MDGRYFQVIARIHTDFSTKFGIPRQSGRIPDLKAEIVFEPEYRNPDALRGIEEFSHLWLIWEFSGAVRANGPRRCGPPGWEEIRGWAFLPPGPPSGPIRWGFPPCSWIPWSFTRTGGRCSMFPAQTLWTGRPFTISSRIGPLQTATRMLWGALRTRPGNTVFLWRSRKCCLKGSRRKKRESLKAVLAHDPRPSYQDDPERVYGMEFAGYEIKFMVENGILRVTDIELR